MENECKTSPDTQHSEDEKYMRMALQEARAAAAEDEIPIGAIIVCRGRVIARAHNLTELLHDVTAHAEMQAITAAADSLGGKYLTDCTMYVTVEPCTMCAGAIGWAQIARLVYGASDEKRGYRRLAGGALHPKTEVTHGILAEECATLIQDFSKPNVKDIVDFIDLKDVSYRQENKKGLSFLFCDSIVVSLHPETEKP